MRDRDRARRSWRDRGRRRRRETEKRDKGERQRRGTAERDEGEEQWRETRKKGKEERQWERDSEESHQETPHPQFLAPPHAFNLSITVLPQIHLNVEAMQNDFDHLDIPIDEKDFHENQDPIVSFSA